ncbi:MAG: choice-of-anchor Q domain-containing protein [Paludibacteraceae bacterium]|nr:choice-of-anchor Q domain-containing protein [Paludibacteraceae bacterium]
MAAGTYYGDTTLSTVVNLAPGISLYGGFEGTEKSLAARDTAKNSTIIDGKNTRRVITQNYGFADSMAVVVDGFTIQNGKMANGGGAYLSTNTTINNCIIKSNKASENGSAIYATNATIKNCQILGNTYTNSLQYTVRLNNCKMDSCVLKGNRSGYYAAILAENKSTVTNCLFEGNSSYYNYRGSYFNGSEVSNCKFVNTNGSGACVELYGSSLMTNCLFEGNTEVNSSVVNVNGGSRIEDSQIQNNTTSSNLVYLHEGKANRCSVKGNTTSDRIMTMYYASSSISNSLICDNNCTNAYNEPVYNDRGNILNCTFVNNTSKHNKFMNMQNATLKNSILVGNQTNTNYSGVFNLSGTNTIKNNMLESTFINGNIDGSMTYAAFTDAENGDYSLSANSYCINAGADVADSLDLLGKARKQGGAVDMGAIESSHKKAPALKSNEIVYVKSGSNGDGTSWESAFGDIPQAIFAASADGKKHQIWVAAGTYYGDTTLSTVVNLAPGISLYGGFAGNEKSLAARDTANNPTILDGKNKRRVITQNYGFADSMAVVVDGFTIQNGYMNNGGGAYLCKNTTLTNCIVKNCRAIESGSAVYANGANVTNSIVCDNGIVDYNTNRNAALYLVSAKLDSCIVKNNSAYYTSALQAESTTITNSLFEGNGNCNDYIITLSKSRMYDCKMINNVNNTYSSDQIVYLSSGSTVERCLIDGNDTYYQTVYLTGSSTISNSQITKCRSRASYLIEIRDNSKMINCTVADNVSSNQTVYCYNAPQILNSIVVGNKRTNNSESVYVNGATIKYSMIEGGANGEGNIDGSKSSAAFADASKGDYSLSGTSLCINAGTDVADSLDLNKNVRRQSEAVDMGAIESSFTERATVGSIIYVKAGSDGSGLSWDDALGEINQAVTLASTTGNRHDIWVAKGTYLGDTSLISAISLSAGVNLYGGFAGTESSLDERSPKTNVTIIDGRYKRRCIIQNYDFADSLAIVVDGFTIQNGYLQNNSGVNVKSKKNTTFNNCIFRNARTGNEGVYAERSIFRNCQFIENKIQDLEIYGGVVDSCSFSDNTTTQSNKIVYLNGSRMSNSQICGITNEYGIIDAVENSVISYCKIMNNKIRYYNTVYLSNSTLENSLVCGNEIYNSGYSYSIISADYNSFITNSTIAHNKTRNSSAVSCNSSSPKKYTTIANSIIYGNKVTDVVLPQVVTSDYMKVKYCASDGDLVGENNIKLATSNSGSDASKNYVCFINAAGGDYRLHATSACIDKGLDSVMTAKTDIIGGARVYGKAIDLGAIEFDGEYVQMLDYSQVVCYNSTSLEATFDSTISKIDWKIDYVGNVTGFETTSGTGTTIPSMQLRTSGSNIDTLTLKVTPYDKSGVAGVPFNYNYYVYPDFSKKKVNFARPQVAYVVNEQNNTMTIEWNRLILPVEVDKYDLYVWKASQEMPSTPIVSFVKDHSKYLSGLDNHTTYKYMVKAAIACDTVCSDIDSFRIDIPVSLEVSGNVNCVFGSKLNETSSLTRYVKGFELTDSITYTISGKDAADFSAKFENGWDKLNGGYLRIYYTPTDVKKQTSDAEITIKSGNSGKYEITLYLAGTLSNYYVYDAVVDKDVYHAGDTVDVTGILTDAYGTPMAGKTLTIEANSNVGFTHSTTGVTDSTGRAAVKFATEKTECGTYTVKVYVGSKSENVAYASFDIPGMAYTGGTTKWTIQKGDTIDGTITITNRSSVDLHNLVVETRQLADGLLVEFDTLKLLKGSESARIPLKATGTKLTDGKSYLPSVFRVSCDENTTCDFSTYFYCEQPYGQIKVSPTNINEYVSKQKPKYINIELTNAGFGETGDITLSLPDFAGFSVPSTKLSSIKSGDTLYVPLKLVYFEGAPINVPYTGSIGVNCSNGKSTSLPFRVEYSSESKGSLEVDVVDEYFYNTADKKHLNGAKVVVRNQYNNQEVASGYSDTSGIVKFDSIPEGSYLLCVKADKHSEYQETIEIQAGQKLDKFVFLAYQAITYTWNVERVEIEDKYDINLDFEYETNVPAPVVTLSFPNGVPDKSRFEIGVPKTVRLQITNHGLIAAHYVKFGMPRVPYYRFYVPYNYIDSLPANHTEFVPVTIVRTDDEFGAGSYISGGDGILLEDESFGTSECPNVHAEYSYVCGVLRQLSTVSQNAWGCPYLVSLTGNGGPGGGGFDIPLYGGGSSNDNHELGNVKNNHYSINLDIPCNSCQSKINPWGCVGNILGHVPVIGSVLEWGVGKLNDAFEKDKEERLKRQSCEVFPDEEDDWFGDMDFDTPFESLDAVTDPIQGLQSAHKASKMIMEYRKDPDNFDMYKAVDFVYEETTGLIDNVEIPIIGSVPWGCLDLICQQKSCEIGRYAENCGRYLYDRALGKNEEDEDTRNALTEEGDTVVIVNGQIEDVIYKDGTRMSDYEREEQKQIEREKAKFNLQGSIYRNASSLSLAAQDAVEFTGLLQYQGNIMKEITGSSDVLSENGILDYFDYTIKNYSRGKKIDIDSIKKMPTIDLSTTEMVEIAQRWNETLVANENGVYSPNEEYPNIIDKKVIATYMDSIINFYTYMKLRNFGNIYDMLSSVNEEVHKPSQKSICASVKLHIAQTLTMTREAFDGTLTVNNGNESGAMEGFKVVLEVRDENGELANDLFQINTQKLTGISAIDGTGEIAPKSEGTALFRFIPEKGAAPTSPINYSFGGYIVYVDPSSGDTVKADLFPVTLTVNPSPDLQIDYFMQRNILSDDALTLDRVEPSVPAALGVRIDNQGYGIAKNVKLETAQPEIEANEKGLLIDFAIIGSSLNGKDCDLGSENIDFGNIEAHSAKTGVWWLTSSLLGHFTKYEASVVHANSFGNPELSLVKGIAIHELIKTVDAYGVKDDHVVDFLVNDKKDDNDTPDAIYYSDGGNDEVNQAQRATLDKKMVTMSDTVVKLTVTPSKTGWNYAQMSDPGDNCYDIVKVVRVKDSVEIPLSNVWTTFVTLPDGEEPIYVNRLHFLDYMTAVGENDYNIYYSIKKNVLKVAEISGVPTGVDAVTSPVNAVVVKFNRKIQNETFDYNDIELYCQGGENLSDPSITVVQQDDYTYLVDISSKTNHSGFYKIEVNVNNILDEYGNAGDFGKNATWSQLLEFVSVVDVWNNNDSIVVYADHNHIYVKSSKAGSLDIYDILSRLIVKNARYDEGVTQIAVLPKGIYIVNGNKVIVK